MSHVRGSYTGPEFDGPWPGPDRRPKFDKALFDGRPEPHSKFDVLTPPAPTPAGLLIPFDFDGLRPPSLHHNHLFLEQFKHAITSFWNN